MSTRTLLKSATLIMTLCFSFVVAFQLNAADEKANKAENNVQENAKEAKQKVKENAKEVQEKVEKEVESDKDEVKKSESTPLRISFWPDVWAWPKGLQVYGLSLGIPSSYSPDKKNFVSGADLSLLLSETKTYGFQASMVNMSTEGSDGLQCGMINLQNKNYDGVQASIYNEYEDSSGLQLGIVNKAENSKGVQIGLLNMMDNGIFPVFPFFNYNL